MLYNVALTWNLYLNNFDIKITGSQHFISNVKTQFKTKICINAFDLSKFTILSHNVGQSAVMIC